MDIKKILILSLDWTKVGGAENYAINLKHGLIDAGHSVTIMAYVNKLDVNSEYDIMINKNTNFESFKSIIFDADLIFINGGGNYEEDKYNEPAYYKLLEIIGISRATKMLLIHGPRQFTHTKYFNLILQTANVDKLLVTRKSVINYLDNQLMTENKHLLHTTEILKIPVDMTTEQKFMSKCKHYFNNVHTILMTSRVTPYKKQFELAELCKKEKIVFDIYGINTNTDNEKENVYINKLNNTNNCSLHRLFCKAELDEIHANHMFHANVSDYSDKINDYALETTSIEAITRGCIPIVSNQMSEGLTHLKDSFIVDFGNKKTSKELSAFINQGANKLKTIHENALKVIKNNNRNLVANTLIKYLNSIEDDKNGVDLALKKTLQIRKNRRKMYGDGFLTAKDMFFVSMISEKTARLNYLYESGNNQYEKLEDTLIDLANYALMYLEVQLRK